MKLYYAPDTRATRARWMLEELGVEYDLARLDLRSGEHRQEEFRMIAPLQKVPLLVDGSRTVFESLGICLYLADRFPEHPLAPPLGSAERGAYCQWMAFSMGTLEPGILAVFRERSLNKTKLSGGSVKAAEKNFHELASVLDAELEKTAFLLGDALGAADVINGSICLWAKSNGLLEDHPNLLRWSGALSERPAYRRAVAD